MRREGVEVSSACWAEDIAERAEDWRTKTEFFSGQINFPERRPRAVCRNVKDQSKVESGKDLKEYEQHSTRGSEEG